MKSNKGTIILTTVVLACAVGFIVSPLVDWPVEKDSASGNIAKSSRFSRKTAAESLTNMEELLVSDENYKNAVIATHVIMQTRVRQFGNLVTLSSEAAGKIPEFSSLLKEMNGAGKTAVNACLTLLQATTGINSALKGNDNPDLAQNTLNASLAYSTLQKQNKLADRFIATTDKYLAKSEGDNLLKFVRDQWVEYQMMTAAIKGDEKSVQTLKDKGYLLTTGQSLATLNGLAPYAKICSISEAKTHAAMGLESNLSEALSDIDLGEVLTVQDGLLMKTIGDAIAENIRKNRGEGDADLIGESVQYGYAEAVEFMYGEIAQSVNNELAQNFYNEAAQNSYGEAAQNFYGEAAQNSYGEAAQNFYGEAAQNSYGEAAQNFYGEAAQNSYGEAAQNFYGEAAQNSYGEAAQNFYGEAAQNSYGEAAQNFYNEAVQSVYSEAIQFFYGEAAQNFYNEVSNDMFGELVQNNYGEAAQNFYNEAAQNSYGEAAQSVYGEYAQNFYSEAIQNFYGEVVMNVSGEAAQNSYSEAVQEIYG